MIFKHLRRWLNFREAVFVKDSLRAYFTTYEVTLICYLFFLSLFFSLSLFSLSLSHCVLLFRCYSFCLYLPLCIPRLVLFSHCALLGFENKFYLKTDGGYPKDAGLFSLLCVSPSHYWISAPIRSTRNLEIISENFHSSTRRIKILMGNRYRVITWY